VGLRYPDFVCIGAQKAGTTWLHANLCGQPGVWLPPIKELQYFNEVFIPEHRRWTRDHRRNHATTRLVKLVEAPVRPIDWTLVAELAHVAGGEISDAWYGQVFDFAPQEAITGELTPEYSLLPEEGIRHILSLNRRTKIIFMVRDMIDRAWSHIRMLAAAHENYPSVEDLVGLAGLADILDRSNYNAILSRWLALWPADQFLLLNYDDVSQRPAYLLKMVGDFLGIPVDRLSLGDIWQHLHVGVPGVAPPEVCERLKEKFHPLYEEPHDLIAGIVAPWRSKHFSV